MMIVRYSSYFRMLLSMFGISMKQYYELSDNDRYDLQKSLCESISIQIRKYFSSSFQSDEDDYYLYAMENFIDEYHGAFEPSRIDEINEAMDRSYEEYLQKNPPTEDDDELFISKYGKPMTDLGE